MSQTTVDWDQAGAEAVARLRAMIRFDTTNPPGQETALAQHLAGELRAGGIEAQVLESTPGRGNLVARLPGSGSGRPVLLLSHLDVVPAEAQLWSRPPFAGELEDGYVWGRGAIDSKLTGALHVQLALMCRRAGLPLQRDLVVVAAADEEFGGHRGVEWLVAEHPEWFEAEYALNEAGGFAVPVAGRPLYTCQVAEKGSAPVDLICRGRPGHSSVPHGDNALFPLGAALVRLADASPPHRVTPTVQAFFRGAAAAQTSDTVAHDLLAALEPAGHRQALARLPVEPAVRHMLDAMLRNTWAPTVVQGGIKRNVIPASARVQLSGRPLPGVDQDTFMRELRDALGTEAELVAEPFRPGLEFDHGSALFEHATAALQQFEPGAPLVPYMQTGGTDARFLGAHDMTVYGFVPMRYEPGLDFFELCHGHDERVSVANVRFGVQVLHALVCRLNGLAD